MPSRYFARVAALGLLATLAACGRGVLLGAPPSSPARARIEPRNGLEIIGAMRRAHPARALKTVAFTVRATEYRTDSSRTAEARAFAQLPGRFRLSILPTSRRSGFVRDGTQLSVFERGRRVASVNRLDLAMLLAYDVFAQSIDSTVRWLDIARVRVGLLRRDQFDGDRVWVIGADEGDVTSAQFWVDAERWRVVRVIQRDPRAPSTIIDIRFSDFDEFLDVPLPLRIETYLGDRLMQRQEISDVAVNPPVPSRAFDLSQWRELRVGK